MGGRSTVSEAVLRHDQSRGKNSQLELHYDIDDEHGALEAFTEGCKVLVAQEK